MRSFAALLLLSAACGSSSSNPTSGGAGGGGGQWAGGAGGAGGAAGAGGAGQGGVAGTGGAVDPAACSSLVLEGGILEIAWTGDSAFRPRLVRTGAAYVLVHGAGKDESPDPASIHAVALPEGDWTGVTLPAGPVLSPTGGRSFVASADPDGTYSLLYAGAELDDVGAPKETGLTLARGLTGASPLAATTSLEKVSPLGHALVLAPFDGGSLVGLRDAASGELRLAKVDHDGVLEHVGAIACAPNEFQPWAASALSLPSGEVLVAHACSPSGSSVPLTRVGASGVEDTGQQAAVGGQNEVVFVEGPPGAGWLVTQAAVAFHTSDWISALDEGGVLTGEDESVGGILTIMANGRPTAARLGGGLALAIVKGDEIHVQVLGAVVEGASVAPPKGLASSFGIGAMDMAPAPDGRSLVLAWTDVGYPNGPDSAERHLRVARLACAP